MNEQRSFSVSMSCNYIIGNPQTLELSEVLKYDFKVARILMNPITIPVQLPTLVVHAGIWMIDSIYLGDKFFKEPGQPEDSFNYSPLCIKLKCVDNYIIHKNNSVIVKGSYNGHIPVGYLTGCTYNFCVTLDGLITY